MDQAASKAVDAGADVVREKIDELAPEDTGNLKEKIQKSAVQQDGNFVFSEVGLLRGTDAETARYSNAQEYGFVRGGKHYPGKAFVRSGFQQSKSRVRQAQKKALEDEGVI